MKTPEEINAIKSKTEELSKELAELSDEELDIVTGALELDGVRDFYEKIGRKIGELIKKLP